MVGNTLNERFQLEQLLHDGETGSLFLATDTASGEMLAIRGLPGGPELLRGAGGLRYQRLLKRLEGEAHPNLLIPLETGVAQGTLYQLLPYYPSTPLDQALQARPLPLAEGVEVLRQVASALAHLHARGIAHLGVGPHTVLVSEAEGAAQVVLADPCLPLLMGGPFPFGGLPVASFRAPEEVPWLDGAPDERADLYALGMLGYLILAGRVPFTGVSVRQVLLRHLGEEPPPPHSINPELPERLSRMLLRLVAKAPQARYQSAAGLLADLNDWDAEAPPPLGKRDQPRARPGAPPLRGREGPVEEALAALGRCASGRGTFLLFSAEAGAGMHGLFRSLLPHVEAGDGLILQAPPQARDWSVPFHLPLTLLEDLCARWPGLPATRRRYLAERITGRLRGRLAALTALCPALGELLPAQATPPPLPPGRRRHHMLHTLAELFATLAEPRHPLVLRLGDLAGADADSLDWLSHLLRHIGGAALLPIARITQPGETPDGPLPAWLRRHGGDPALLRVELGPLTKDALTALTRHRLGLGAAHGEEEEAGGLPARLAAWIGARWGGNPLAHEWVLAALLERGLLRPVEPGGGRMPGWLCAWDKVEQVALPSTLEGLLEARLASLTEAQRQVLEFAAVFPGPFTLFDLANVAEHLPLEALLDRVEEAVASGILGRAGERLVFRHRLFREHFDKALPAARREHLHRLLGATLETHPQRAPLLHHHTAFLHFERGGDTARATRHALAAANTAKRHQALAGAVALYRTVLPRLEEGGQGAALLVSLGGAQAMLGHSTDALATLGRARSLGLPAPLLMEAHRLAAWAEAQRGAPEAALARLEEALALLEETLPSSPLGGTLARLAAGARNRYAGLKTAAGAPGLEPLEGREFTLAGLLEQAALLLARLDPPRAVLTDEKLLRIAAGRRPAPIMARALIRLAPLRGEAGNRYLQEAEALTRSGAFPYETAQLEAARGEALLRAFELGAAKDALFLAGEGFRELGDPGAEAAVLRPLFEIARLQGPCGALLETARRQRALATLLAGEGEARWAEAMEVHAGVLAGKTGAAWGATRMVALAEAAETDGDTTASTRFLLLAGELALATDAPEQALATLAPLPAAPAPPAEVLSLRIEAVRAEAHLLQAIEQAEDTEWCVLQAEPLLAALRDGEPDFPCLAPERALLEVMRLLATGGTDAALELAGATARLLEARGATLALGRLQLRLAAGLKARVQAGWREHAGKALALFGDAGASLWAQAARELLEDGGAGAFVGQDAAPGALPGGQEGATIAAALLDLVEQAGPINDASAASLQRGMLQMLCQAAGAEYGMLFLADGADGVAPAAATRPSQELPEVNRWLVSTVWREGREELLEKFQVPREDGTGDPPQSALCLPLAGQGERLGVIYLGSAAERMTFDRADLRRLQQPVRQAGAALAMAMALAAGKAEGARLAQQSNGWGRLWESCTSAAAREEPRGMLTALLAANPAPERFVAALLYWAVPERTRLVLAAHTLPTLPPELAAWGEVSLAEGVSAAAAALKSGTAVRVATLAAANGESQEAGAWEALGARSALWLPLPDAGLGPGAVLLLSAAEPGGEEPAAAPIMESAFRMLAPALDKARRQERLAAEQEQLQERLHAAEAANAHLQRFVPAYLRKRGEGAPGAPPEEGEEIWRPIVAGRIFDLTRLSRLGKGETLKELGAYYRRIGDALTLHHGNLERILGDCWIARYEQGPENALWGALTLHQMLLSFQEEHGTGDVPVLRTGIGVHVGMTIGGTVETDQRLEPIMVGEGVQVASHLADMCRTFRTGVLLSDETVQALDDVKPFLLRSLGLYRIAPGEKRIGVYELYSGRPPEIAQAMQVRQAEWNAAMRLYRLGQWNQAAQAFQNYLTYLPQDRPARHFLRECRQLREG